MISKENFLELENRKKIYNYILKNPGIHLQEVSRKTNISYSTLRHHLDYLKKQGLITTKSNRRYTRYYVTQKVGKKDKEIISLVREEIPRKIILLLLCPWFEANAGNEIVPTNSIHTKIPIISFFIFFLRLKIYNIVYLALI